MYDLLVVGGGINGAGIARDAAGRGLSVLLCEKDDLAAHTSSASTKLIHGGLRYLEYYDFKLVRKALQEREVLLQLAPHIIWPMRFVLPFHKGLRPAWLIRLGLFLYDHIGGRKKLPSTSVVRGRDDQRLVPLDKQYSFAFEYSDCWVDDARLVVLNALDAAERGATVMTRAECTSIERKQDIWQATLRVEGGADMAVEARAIVNAAGPWVDDVLDQATPRTAAPRVRLVKGSHVITRKLYEGDHAYFFQNADNRIMFAIPYQNGELTLLGTTDIPFEADKDVVEISKDEIDYICSSASTYFERAITSADVVETYSGVRPLYDDRSENAAAVTRDYVLARDDNHEAPLISVYGGKITTYRQLAEGVMNLLEADFDRKMTGSWTSEATLPGGDILGADFESFAVRQVNRYSWLDEAVVLRLLRAYGTRIDQLLAGATSVDDLGFHYGCGLYQCEVDYLIEHEFALSADDILSRRSKLALHMKSQEIDTLRDWFDRRVAA